MADIGPTSTRLTDLQHSWEKDPGSRVYLQLADEYRKHARHVEAIDVLKKGLALRPNDLSGLVSLGRCHFELGELEAAAEALENVITRDPAHIVANKLLLEIYLQAGNAEKAGERLDLYKLLNEADPDLASLEAWLRTLRSGVSAAAATAPPAETPPAEAPPAEAPPPAVPQEAPSDPAAFETLQAAEIQEAMAPEAAEEPLLTVAPREEPLLTLSEEQVSAPPLAVEEPMAAEAVFELEEGPAPEVEESVSDLAEEPLPAAPAWAEEPVFDLEGSSEEVTLDEAPLAGPSPLLDEPAFELETSPAPPAFEAPAFEAPPFEEAASAAEPVFELEPPSAPFDEVAAVAEEPVFELEAPPDASGEAEGVAEEPVFDFEDAPASSEDASFTVEEPAFELDAPAPPAAFDAPAPPPVFDAPAPPAAFDAPAPPPVFDAPAPPAVSEESPFSLEEPAFEPEAPAPPEPWEAPDALATVEASQAVPEPAPAATGIDDIFDLGPPPEPESSADDIFNLGFDEPLAGPSDSMLDDLWEMSAAGDPGGAPEPEAGAAEPLLSAEAPAPSVPEPLPEPEPEVLGAVEAEAVEAEAVEAEVDLEPAPEEALEIAPEPPVAAGEPLPEAAWESAPEEPLPEEPLPEEPLSEEPPPDVVEQVQLEPAESPPTPEALGEAARPAPATAKVPADESDSFTEPATATLGELYFKQGHFEEAEKIFRLVLRHEPNNSAALRGLEQIRWKIPGAVTAEKLLEGTGVEGRISEGLTAKKVMVLGRYLQHLRKSTGDAHVR